MHKFAKTWNVKKAFQFLVHAWWILEVAVRKLENCFDTQGCRLFPYLILPSQVKIYVHVFIEQNVKRGNIRQLGLKRSG